MTDDIGEMRQDAAAVLSDAGWAADPEDVDMAEDAGQWTARRGADCPCVVTVDWIDATYRRDGFHVVAAVDDPAAPLRGLVEGAAEVLDAFPHLAEDVDEARRRLARIRHDVSVMLRAWPDGRVVTDGEDRKSVV